MRYFIYCIMVVSLFSGCAKSEIINEYFENGKLRAQWRYVDGQKEGVSTVYDKDGNPFFIARLKAGKMEGTSTEYIFWNGKKEHVADWKCKADKCNGYESKSGKLLAELPFKDGFPNGPGKFYYDTGELKETATFLNGSRHGMEIAYYKTGEKMGEIIHENGLRQGLSRFFHKNGNIKSTTEYLDDNPLGKNLQYYENGKLKSESFIRVQRGLTKFYNAKEYYENGLIKQADTTNKKTGRLEMRCNYDEQGRLVSEKDYIKKELRMFDEKGKLISTAPLTKKR